MVMLIYEFPASVPGDSRSLGEGSAVAQVGNGLWDVAWALCT